MAWYDEFFNEDYFKTYFHLDWERTAREADFIETTLELSREDLILDIPCGFGRHSIELTERGYKVVGMEYNKAQIDRAKELMKEKNVEFEILRADMRDIPHKKRYDKMFNYFTSFGYFSDEENEKTMENFRDALKPGGLFLMEMINRDGLLKSFQPYGVTRLPENGLFLEERKYNPLTGRMECIHTYIDTEGTKRERKFDHRIYTAYELVNLFKKYGFEVIKIFGERDKKLEVFSRRISLVGRKV